MVVKLFNINGLLQEVLLNKYLKNKCLARINHK